MRRIRVDAATLALNPRNHMVNGVGAWMAAEVAHIGCGKDALVAAPNGSRVLPNHSLFTSTLQFLLKAFSHKSDKASVSAS